MAQTTFQGPVKSINGFIGAGVGNVVSLTADTTLTVADHAGRILTCNDADGKFTLPTIIPTADANGTGPGNDINNTNNLGKFTETNNKDIDENTETAEIDENTETAVIDENTETDDIDTTFNNNVNTSQVENLMEEVEFNLEGVISIKLTIYPAP